MNKTNNPKLKGLAQKLRREMTKEERRLWYEYLKDLPVNINRQKVIGNYIADFYCATAKVIIELDGSQHYEEKGQQKDKERDNYFSEHGITVLRYTNCDISENFDGVCEDIEKHLAPFLNKQP